MRILTTMTAAAALAASAAALAQPARGQAQSNAAVCALFSVADAQKIMGGTMRPKPNQGDKVCMYELTQDYGTVALTVDKASDKAAEDRAWAFMKEVRHLQPGQKNTRPLAGVGDEAWFTGDSKNGKVGLSAVIVRKGNAHFAIDVATLDYRASPQALTDVAKSVAQHL